MRQRELPSTTGTVAQRLADVRERIARAAQRAGRSPDAVTLVAVTKTVPVEAIAEAYEAGARHFGENRVQEAKEKLPQLAHLTGATWHLIGHLQTNKVKDALALFSVVHSIDSLHLAEALSKRAPSPVRALLEVNVSGEAAKAGFAPGVLPEALAAIRRLPNLRVEGLMTMAPLMSDPEQARPFFRRLRERRDQLGLADLSMGMTNDFEVAVEEGATLVRVGRAIFGER